MPGQCLGYGAAVTARVHPVHLTNVGQRRAAADRPTKPTDLGVESACRLIAYSLDKFI